MYACIYIYVIDVQKHLLMIIYIHIYRNSTLQRIILQKSSEWTPKKSKKKIRAETENSEDSGEVLMCIFVCILIYICMYMMHMYVRIHVFVYMLYIV
jgi:K+-sensing histidine kinase KdpD